MKSIQWCGLGVALSLGLAACETSKVDVMGTFPAGNPDVASLRTIAVLDFGGRDGAAFTNMVRSELSNATLDGQAYFNVVSDDELVSRSGVGRFDGSAGDITAILQYGRNAGVDAVYFGEVDTFTVQETRTGPKQRKHCTEYEGILNCKTEIEYTVQCFRVDANYGATPQVININTGQVAYSERLAGHSKHTYCIDSYKNEGRDRSDEYLLGDARTKVVKNLRRAVAPYNARMEVDLKTEAPTLSAERQAVFDSALEFAQAGRMDRACALYEQASDMGEQTDIALLYNLAVCAEVAGDWRYAVETYQYIDSQLTAPDKQVFEALERSRAQMQTEVAVEYGGEE